MAKMLGKMAATMGSCACCAILNLENSKDRKRSKRIMRAREKKALDRELATW